MERRNERYSRIELFAENLDQARLFLGSVMTDANGHFQWSGEMQLSSVTATVTDAAGNTSELAASQPVSVELLSFAVFFEKSHVRLQWTTVSESNNFGFHIERKQLGWMFAEIGFVKGAGTATVSHSYHFYDVTQQGSCPVYRLRQEDYDGAVTYSSEVRLLPPQEQQFTLSAAWPNPFNGSTRLNISVPHSAILDISVYNIRGELVRTLLHEHVAAGEYQVHWDGRDATGRQVSSGIYFICMKSDQDELQIFTKVLYLR